MARTWSDLTPQHQPGVVVAVGWVGPVAWFVKDRLRD